VKSSLEMRNALTIGLAPSVRWKTAEMPSLEYH